MVCAVYVGGCVVWCGVVWCRVELRGVWGVRVLKGCVCALRNGIIDQEREQE